MNRRRPPLEGGGGHKHGSPHVIGGGAGSELDALLKELEGLSASDLEKSIKVGVWAHVVKSVATHGSLERRLVSKS